MLESAVGDTTTDAAAAAPVSEGSPASIDSSSQSDRPSADSALPSDKGFAEKAFALANAGSDPPQKRGSLPFDRHEAILGKQREELAAREAAWNAERAEWEQYGWAKNVDPAALQRYADLDQKFAEDPVGTIWGLVQALQRNPQTAPQWRELVTRELGQGAQRTARAEEPKPDVRHKDPETGQIYEWYSAPQQAKRDAWLREQMMTELRGELQPLQEGVRTFQQLHQQAATEKASHEKAQEIYDSVQALPGLRENQKEIAAEVDAMFRKIQPTIPAEAAGNPAIVQALLSDLTHKAYAKIVVPKLTEAGRVQATTDLSAKARASTRNPRTPASAAPTGTDTRSFAEKLAAKVRAAQ